MRVTVEVETKKDKKTNMKLVSLETTPNPNCMKLNLDEQIVDKPVSGVREAKLS
jgi:hypothetical protein